MFPQPTAGKTARNVATNAAIISNCLEIEQGFSQTKNPNKL
jgi:hypothetical protein